MIESRPAPLVIGHHVLPQRQVMTAKGSVWVPSHVYRANHDSGWKVEIKRTDENYFTRHFADSHYSHNQERSLEYALETLYDELPHHATHNQLHAGSSLYYQVREYRRKKSGTLVTQVQTYICSYMRKLRCVTFYVGTENTQTPGRLQRAIDRAMGTRQWSIDTIKAEGRDVLIRLPVPPRIENYGS